MADQRPKKSKLMAVTMTTSVLPHLPGGIAFAALKATNLWHGQHSMRQKMRMLIGGR
jgi:hypothetical protein